VRSPRERPSLTGTELLQAAVHVTRPLRATGVKLLGLVRLMLLARPCPELRCARRNQAGCGNGGVNGRGGYALVAFNFMSRALLHAWPPSKGYASNRPFWAPAGHPSDSEEKLRT